MIQIETVQPGDTLVWMGKCGEISGKVKRVANGMLAAFTDEVHSFPIELLCCSNGARLIEGNRLHTTTAEAFQTIDEAPVLF